MPIDPREFPTMNAAAAPPDGAVASQEATNLAAPARVIRLHADFDRDGKISASNQEHNAANVVPGVILLPNLDADRRRPLPLKLTEESGDVVLDYREKLKALTDHEPAAIEIHAQPTSDRTLMYQMKILGFNARRAALIDQSRRKIEILPGTRLFNQYPVSLPGYLTKFYLEVHTLAGSPAGKLETLSTSLDRGYTRRDEASLQVELLEFRADGTMRVADGGTFTIAPLIFMDNARPAERVYIAESDVSTRDDEASEAENMPSIRDLQQALITAGGVPLVLVPKEISNGDEWLQDQFKIGYCHASYGYLRLVLHFPRFRANAVLSENPSNLAHFTRAHFPSPDIALFDDLLTRFIPIQDMQGSTHHVAFQDSYILLLVTSSVHQLYNSARDTRIRLQKEYYGKKYEAKKDDLPAEKFVPKRRALDDELLTIAMLVAVLKTESKTTEERKAQLDELFSSYAKEGAAVQQAVVLVPGGVMLQIPDREVGGQLRGSKISIVDDEANQLVDRLNQMHSAANYGGNILVGPPSTDAPLGKLMVGNTSAENQDTMDPDLLYLLRSQNVQPVVEVGVEWLRVGHLDEVVSFVPTRQGNGPIVALVASPEKGMEILLAAAAKYKQGLSWKELQDFDSDVIHPTLPRETKNGTNPVTMMLRGKEWLHHQPDKSFDRVLPPLMYRELVKEFAVPNAVQLPLKYGPGPDRHYSARISVFEYLLLAYDTNAIAQEFCDELTASLETAIPGMQIVEIPVLFDLFEASQTGTFLPDCVNLQVVNGHLMTPRPYGPRMAASTAIEVIREVLPEEAQAGVDSKLIQRRQLSKVFHWAEHPAIFNDIFTDDAQLGEVFGDGTPKIKQADLRKLIVAKNQGAFQKDGNLRPGWHRLLMPEETVDLFELYIEAVLGRLGAPVHWIDSWFYHVRFGELHCGTNVMRKPDIRPLSAWWRKHPAWRGER